MLVSNEAALPPTLAGARLRHLPFQRPAPSAAARVLAGVCAAEGRPLGPAALRALVQLCRCDLRCAGALWFANSCQVATPTVLHVSQSRDVGATQTTNSVGQFRPSVRKCDRLALCDFSV